MKEQNTKLILTAKTFWNWIVKKTTSEIVNNQTKVLIRILFDLWIFNHFSLFEGEAEVAAVEAVVTAVEDSVATKEATEATAA